MMHEDCLTSSNLADFPVLFFSSFFPPHCLDCERNCGSFAGSAVTLVLKKQNKTAYYWRKHTIQISFTSVWLDYENLITVFFLFCWSTENDSHLVITPQSPVLEIGTTFTATCMINTNEVTADDLYWKLLNVTVSKEHYTKINRSALSVTIPVTGEKSEWLMCQCKKDSNYVTLNKGKFIHGITLTKGCKFLLPECVEPVAVF